MTKRVSFLPGKKYNQHYTQKNSAEWIQSGKNYFILLEQLIDSARHEIHLQTYIFASDATGTRIAEALIRAAERSVQIFLLVDAYGSQQLSVELIGRLIKAGVNFRKYGELYSRGRFHIGRRMHHKVTVFDGHTSVVGGINISDQYNELPLKPAWLDFAVVMRGNISRRLLYVCRRRWSGWKFSFRSKKQMLSGFEDYRKGWGLSPIRVRRNDFIRNKNEISITYRNAFRQASESILLVGGYFLPGGRTRRIMRRALERGVKIDVVVSEKSDVRIVTFARRYLYDWMMRHGVGVYEYIPSNVHGKVIVTDEKWTSIGSYDLNNLSTYSNIELNVDIEDRIFSESIATHIKRIIRNDCVKVTTENPYRKKSVFTKLMMWSSYRFVKTLFILSVILAGKKEKEF
jgi:cardiolipin synthase